MSPKSSMKSQQTCGSRANTMLAHFFDRVEQSTWRLYRIDPERLRREEDLRAALLRRLILGTSLLVALYASLALARVLSSRFFPYDALELALTLAFCRWLLRHGRTSSATMLLLVVLSHPAGFAVAEHGIGGPAAALFLPSLLVCGLLVGGYFLSSWTVICCLVLLFVAIRAAWGQPASWSPGELLGPLLFWWVLFAAVGWLVHLFTVHLERRWQVEHRQTSALKRMLTVMASPPALETLLDRILAVIGDELGAAQVSLWQFQGHDDQGDLIATTAIAEDAADQAPRPGPGARSIRQELAGGSKVVQIAAPQHDPRVRDWPRLFSAQTAELCLLPIPVAADSAQIMGIDFHEPARFSQEQIELARLLALQLGIFLQVRQLASQERGAAIVEERNRMAQEIHDNLAQGLTGIVVQLNAAEALLARGPEAVQRHLVAARDLARASLGEARRSVWALRPIALAEGSLATALAGVVDQFTVGTAAEIGLVVAGDVRPLPPDVELNILRIGQEAVTNAVRHARAQRITVQLDYEPTHVRLRIEDNGSGEIPAATACGGGAGLSGMDRRARQVGGELTVRGMHGQGTRIELSVPTS